MSDSRTVITIREYGKVTIALAELMEKRGINRNSPAKATNTRFEVEIMWKRWIWTFLPVYASLWIAHRRI